MALRQMEDSPVVSERLCCVAACGMGENRRGLCAISHAKCSRVMLETWSSVYGGSWGDAARVVSPDASGS